MSVQGRLGGKVKLVCPLSFPLSAQIQISSAGERASRAGRLWCAIGQPLCKSSKLILAFDGS